MTIVTFIQFFTNSIQTYIKVHQIKYPSGYHITKYLKYVGSAIFLTNNLILSTLIQPQNFEKKKGLLIMNKNRIVILSSNNLILSALIWPQNFEKKKGLLIMKKNRSSKNCARVDFSVYVILSLFFCHVNFALVAGVRFSSTFFATSIHIHNTQKQYSFDTPCYTFITQSWVMRPCARYNTTTIAQEYYWFYIKASHCCPPKGQLISKSPFGVLKSPKKATKSFPGFLS